MWKKTTNMGDTAGSNHKYNDMRIGVPVRAKLTINMKGKLDKEYAKLRGIILVPELEVPGHATQLVKIYPEIFRVNNNNPNLISNFDMQSYIISIISEGEIGININNEWQGSLDTISTEKGYWLILDEPIIFSWNANFGPIVLRQVGVDNGLTQFLVNGDESDPIFFQGSIGKSKIQIFFD